MFLIYNLCHSNHRRLKNDNYTINQNNKYLCHSSPYPLSEPRDDTSQWFWGSYMLHSRRLPSSPCNLVHRTSRPAWRPPTIHTQNGRQTRPVLGGEQDQEAGRSDLHLPHPIILQVSDMEDITAGERFDLRVNSKNVWTCCIAFHHHYYYMKLHHQISPTKQLHADKR